MRTVRIRVILIFICVLGLGAALLHVSQRVQHAENRRDHIQNRLAAQNQTLRVLQAEWAHVTSPHVLEGYVARMPSSEPDQSSRMGPRHITDRHARGGASLDIMHMISFVEE